MNKIFIAIVMLVSFGFFSPAKTEAAVTFSNTSTCWPDMVQAMPGNVAQSLCGSWAQGGTTVVQAGNTLWVGFYIHNTGTTPAQNLTISLSKTQTSTNNFNFAGSFNASNGGSASGSTSASITSSNAQDFTLTSAQFGMNADGYGNMQITNSWNASQAAALLSGGLNIGSFPGVNDPCIAGGSNSFCSQGMFVATFQASNNQIAPPPPATCTITSFSANPSSVNSGNSSTLSWTTSNCTSASISNIGSVSVNGSQSTGSLYGTTTYTLTASGPNGNPSQSTTVSVNQQQSQCIINYFNASPTSVNSGSSSTLSWSTSNCTSASISNIGSVSVNGTQGTNALYGTTTYTLSAYGPNGNPSQSTTVSVNQNQQTCSINSFYASPSSITQGSGTTLYWYTTGASYATLSGNNIYNNSVSSSGSQYVYPSGTTTYTLTAQCQNGGSQSQSTSVYINQQSSYVCSDGLDNDGDGLVDMSDSGCTSSYDTDEYNQTTSSTITSVATNITASSALLNGISYGSFSSSATGYFEWGPTNSLGSVTSTQSLGTNSTVPFWSTVTGLSTNTYYYFRAVSNRNGVVTKGEIKVFITLGNTQTTTVVNQTIIQGTGTGSNLIDLTIVPRSENICPRDPYDVTVTWKNISNGEIENVIIRVLLPTYATFRSSSLGSYSQTDHAITYLAGDLVKDETGMLFITGDVHPRAIQEDLLVTTGVASYTHPTSDVQEDAIAYGISNTNNCRNDLLGLALFSGFWPSTFWGWLLLILLILAIIYIARRLYRDGRHIGPSRNSHPVYVEKETPRNNPPHPIFDTNDHR